MRINRRNFIKTTLGAGLATCGVGVLLGGCGGSLTRSDVSPTDEPDQALGAGALDDRLRSILFYASLAPSGHNTQPWFVRLSGPNKLIIGADPERRLPAVDPHNREVMLSIGAFTENLVLAAGNMGLKACPRVIATDPGDQDVVDITFEKHQPSSYPLARLTQRMTVKRGYRPNDIKQDDLKYLSQPLKERLFYFPSTSSHAKCIRDGAIENFRAQANRDDAQIETVKWMRLSNRDARRCRDGLTVAGMEITGIKGWFVRHFVAPQTFLKPGFREQSITHTARLAREGGGWLIITSKGHSVADWVDAGRRFERMALLARERNIALQPMTQYLEEAAGLQQFAAHHDARIIPQFVLRVGYLHRYPEPVSLRRPVDWFVRQETAS